MSEERGSVLPLVGGLLFISLIVLGLALDIGLLHAAYRWTASTADVAAEAGAAMVARDRLYEGDLEIDRTQAEIAARDAVARLGSGEQSVEVVASEIEVCVTVTTYHRTTILSAVGASTVSVRVRSCAVPMTG